MRAIEIDRFGEPDVLRRTEVPSPSLAEGEARILVSAAGVNFAETMMRRGRYAVLPELPAVLGSEAVGTVAELAPGSERPTVGTRVAAPLFAAGRLTGGYSEELAIPARLLVPVPEGLSDSEALAAQVQGLTALHLAREVPLRGRTVLVHSAAGGVGSLLVQIARIEGAARVLATAGSPEKLELARSLGADRGIDYRDERWGDEAREATDGRGPDVILDAVGGETTARGLEALAPGGTLVAYGALSLDLGLGTV